MTAILRPVAEDDLPFMHRLTSDPDASGEFQWYGFQNPHRLRERWTDNGMLSDDGGALIIANGDDRVGFVQWTKQVANRASHYWAMGLIVAPEHRGQGHGTQAQRLLARYLFDHTTAHRIEASTEVTNVAEQRALEKAGFTREGVIRGSGFRAGEWRDGVRYSMIRTDL
ncbi:GNAT family N-acetyltransferase [Nonomuraea phyllanthi]|uniref:GNAT family N-acetyltransferase n=1 Tax=Nonomuraea phyllanthi TaxID=2219224 RepID=A0A5C4WTV1_9ACTN|nr:GNAT family protein [Nonomuraea phyllanthi]KAB8196646.1 GNAT family N-acetyltransferase [Nonomuraea phyllanthi]QFY13617.1 GNAT family N-acetyltransferase [Nonomuraea phyllanthi]